MLDKVPVGITLPYTKGDSGFFNQTYSDMQRGLTNLKMLLMTAKGERPMMPSYGSDLREIIFEANTEDYADDLLDDAVKDAVETWMPEVHIISVVSERDYTNEPNQVTVNIKFRLNSIPDSAQQLTLDF
jgi:phage baseplate assembly protein W